MFTNINIAVLGAVMVITTASGHAQCIVADPTPTPLNCVQHHMGESLGRYTTGNRLTSLTIRPTNSLNLGFMFQTPKQTIRLDGYIANILFAKGRRDDLAA